MIETTGTLGVPARIGRLREELFATGTRACFARATIATGQSAP
mgnify:CR=1 FL=1